MVRMLLRFGHFHAAASASSARVARLVGAGCIIIGMTMTASATSLHVASNGNFDTSGIFLPATAGFNIADVSNSEQLESLPTGVKGLVWIGKCDGANEAFKNLLHPYIGNARLFGFYLMDDPDPTGRHFSLCPAENLKAESDWIHQNFVGVRTFIVLMNMNKPSLPSFAGTYNPDNSHIDLFGLDPYPCRTELKGCAYDMIDRYVKAAEDFGIPRAKMIPVFQAFGGGNWADGEGGKYAMPSAEEEEQILSRWDRVVPSPEFDVVYSWSSQNGDVSLASVPSLQAVFVNRHNREASQ